MVSIKKIFTVLVFVGYLSISLFGLFFILTMPHHSMSSMEPCPFMSMEHTLCPMTTLDHINAWRSTVQFNLVKFFSLCVLILCIYISLVLRPPSLAYFYLNKLDVFEDLMTRLFSRGILNPKVF